MWTDSYVLTSRDFGSDDEYGISVYALEKNKMPCLGQEKAASAFASPIILDFSCPSRLVLALGSSIQPTQA